MPTQKDFKRLVRRRMQKTGESYTAARARLLSRKNGSSSGLASIKARAVAKPVVSPRERVASRSTESREATASTDYSRLAGMSDGAIKTGSGRDWQRWVKALDSVDAHTWPHRKIAAYVHETFDVPSWWTQAVTVGYERIRGLREIGQRRGGSYEATKSKTFAVPIGALYDAFTVARTRGLWLPGVKLTVRKATRDKSVRITWEDATSVEVGLTAKGAAKSSASIQHTKLPDKESAARMKAFWSERLDALAKVLTD
jgi:hypothetical protein